jgi:hypothetical protein
MTPEQQKKYYADNAAKYNKKEKDKDYEIFGSRGDAARKGMEEGKTNPMGDTYKKGGKIMNKKAKRYNGEEESVVFETKQGPNKSIDGETRRKAMEMVNLDIDAEPRITKDAPKSAPKSTSKPAAKGDKAFTKAETGGGAALMTRKDRSSMPKPAAKKSSYEADHSMGAAMKKGGSVSSASARADGCAVKGKTRGRMV